MISVRLPPRGLAFFPFDRGTFFDEKDEDADDAASALFGDFFEETTLGLDRRRFEGLAFGLVLPTPTTVPLGLVLGFGATAKSDAA